MKSTSVLISRLVLGLAIFTVFSNLVHADVYDHSGSNGTITDSMWFDQTTGMHGVNPGPGDDAYFYAATITAGGGSVHLLSGGTFSLSGMFTAVDAGSTTLSGRGTLNIQAVVTDANGFGPLLMVDAAHVVAQNGDGTAPIIRPSAMIASRPPMRRNPLSLASSRRGPTPLSSAESVARAESAWSKPIICCPKSLSSAVAFPWQIAERSRWQLT
jgi:hypothetical protein